MPQTAKIVKATLAPFSYRFSDGTGRGVYITQGVQHDPVIPADYGYQLDYTTVGGAGFNLTAEQYHIIDLNAAGLTFLRPGFITRLCLRGGADVNDVEYAMPYTNWLWYHSTQKGAGYRPVLAIHYYPAQ